MRRMMNLKGLSPPASPKKQHSTKHSDSPNKKQNQKGITDTVGNAIGSLAATKGSATSTRRLPWQRSKKVPSSGNTTFHDNVGGDTYHQNDDSNEVDGGMYQTSAVHKRPVTNNVPANTESDEEVEDYSFINAKKLTEDVRRSTTSTESDGATAATTNVNVFRQTSSPQWESIDTDDAFEVIPPSEKPSLTRWDCIDNSNDNFPIPKEFNYQNEIRDDDEAARSHRIFPSALDPGSSASKEQHPQQQKISGNNTRNSKPPPALAPPQLISYASAAVDPHHSTSSDSSFTSPMFDSPVKLLRSYQRSSGGKAQHQFNASFTTLLTPVIGSSSTCRAMKKRSGNSVGLSQYQSTPITKHYELSNQILAAFELNYSNQLFVTAYCIGLQFIETALLEIPKHGYYKSSRHACERLQSTLDATRVASILNELLLSAITITSSLSSASPTSNCDPESYQAVALIGDVKRIQQLYELGMQKMEEASKDQEADATSQQMHEGGGGRGRVDSNLSATMKVPATTAITDSAASSTAATTNTDGGTSSGWVVCDYLAEGTACSTETISSICTNSGLMGSSKNKNDVSAAPSPPTMQLLGNIARKHPPLPNILPSKPQPSSRGRNFSNESSIPGPPLLLSYSSTASSTILNEQLARALFLSGVDVVNSNDNEDQLPPLTASFHLPQQSSAFYGFNISNESLASSNHNESAALIQTRNDRGCEYSNAALGELEQNQQQSNHTSITKHSNSSSQSLSRIELQSLAAIYHDDFFALQDKERVSIRLVNTYQGKNPKSTNGCAVISPLLCIHHMLSNGINNESDNDDFLSDHEITQVIDSETPVVLSSIRLALGLSDNAFLIPSDVHDYLLEQGQLNQSQFLTVTGGNILDDDHLNCLITVLENATNKVEGNDNDQPKRIAATFFFHEHVISILKVQVRSRRSNRKNRSRSDSISKNRSKDNMYCYEFIDSLPYRAMLRRDNETDEDMFARFGIQDGEVNRFKHEEDPLALSDRHPGFANNNTCQQARTMSNISDFLSCNSTDPEDDMKKQMSYGGYDARNKCDINDFDNSATGLESATSEILIAEGVTLGDENAVIVPRTTRIRCNNSDALKAVLRWYACSVFTNENVTYINQYKWDDSTCDFDPRVFQAFVWSS